MLQLHSRMTQARRQNTSDFFRRSKSNCVLFTSDVSARGLDYPDVTHVIQFGAAPDRETYLHRLGRTGRSGKSGEGILVLSELEQPFLKQQLNGLDICENKSLAKIVKAKPSPSVKDPISRIQNELKEENNSTYASLRNKAYLAMLGAYSSRLKPRNDKTLSDLVQVLNAFVRQAGAEELPLVSKKLAMKMGLKSHGLNIGDTRKNSTRFLWDDE